MKSKKTERFKRQPMCADEQRYFETQDASELADIASLFHQDNVYLVNRLKHAYRKGWEDGARRKRPMA